MSKYILLVSYDEQRLLARRKILEREGYRVSSAIGFREAIANGREGAYDLIILGHSIPRSHKERLIKRFRRASNAPVLSLWTKMEEFTDSVNYLAFSDAPDKLLASVAAILAKKDSARASG